MYLKKLLALLLSAALALSLLAGCGGESVARSLLALLDGKYANVSVEMDPDLEADLRQAIRTAESENAGDDAAAIRAALETLLGSKVTFRKLGEGQQGDTAFDLIFAQSAYSQWNGTFSNLPDDGLYTAALAQVQTENGVWLLVQATVDKAGSRDDEPEDLVVKGNGFTYNVTKKTITVEANNADGLQNLLTKQNDEKTQITDARDSGFEKITIELAAGSYSVNSTFTTAFKGILKGESEGSTTINITGGSGLFAQIADDGTVENLNITVAGTISNDSDEGKAGAVAGENNGTISGCTVTIDTSGSISATGGYSNAGGIVGYNYDEISGCKVTINSSISGGYAGGIAGWNEGTISSCEVKGSGKDTSQIHGYKRAGGIASSNGTGTSTSTIEGPCTVTNVFIEARASSNATMSAGGIVGSNEKGSVVSGTCTVSNCKINVQNTKDRSVYAGGIAGYNYKGRVSGGEVKDGTAVSATCGAGGLASAGGIVGYNCSLEGVGDSYSDDTCTITATAGTTTKPSDGAPILEIDKMGSGVGSGVYAGTKVGYQVVQ